MPTAYQVPVPDALVAPQHRAEFSLTDTRGALRVNQTQTWGQTSARRCEGEDKSRADLLDLQHAVQAAVIFDLG